MTTKIDHLAYRVSNIDKVSEQFQKLGYKETRRTDHHGGALEMQSPEQPGLILEFTTLREGEVPGFDHACFLLDNEEQYNELIASGFPGDQKAHFAAGSERLIANFKDPDGTKWQFTM